MSEFVTSQEPGGRHYTDIIVDTNNTIDTLGATHIRKYTIRSIVCEALCHHVIMSTCHHSITKSS